MTAFIFIICKAGSLCLTSMLKRKEENKRKEKGEDATFIKINCAQIESPLPYKFIRNNTKCRNDLSTISTPVQILFSL